MRRSDKTVETRREWDEVPLTDRLGNVMGYRKALAGSNYNSLGCLHSMQWHYSSSILIRWMCHSAGLSG
ncbi:MAG: hypothetical protein ACR2OZ_06300 [Verrucomicrobiales bacterium]